MFRLSPVIVASVQRARNPQAEIERLALGRRKAAPRRLAMEREVWKPKRPENAAPLLELPLLELPRLKLPSLGLGLAS